MKFVRVLGLSVCLGAAALTANIMGAPVISMATAQEAVSLDDVLRAIRREQGQVSEENRQREAEFRQRRNQQQAELNRLRQQVAAAEARSNQLESEFNENEREIAELDAQLAERQGEFGELFGAARSTAAETRAQLESSLISAQIPGRGDPLTEIAQSRTLPRIDQLRSLWLVQMEEMLQQSKVARFTAGIENKEGLSEDRDVVRIGPFTAFSGSNYLKYDISTQRLVFLQRQPGQEARSAAGRVFNYDGDGVVKGVIDPSSGQLLSLLVEAPNLVERINQGGLVGYIVIGLAAFGVLIGVWKLITLNATQGAVKSQMRKQKPNKGNPLGRVMMAYEANRNADVETLQLKLDDAILKELPKLEGGLNTVKVLAAVAPLLGLLGTVTGMIQTFQAITLFGTGDPKLMAGGISQALVTTVLGLVAAVPLLLLHSFANGASRRVSQILEEQAAGMIAEHAENR